MGVGRGMRQLARRACLDVRGGVGGLRRLAGPQQSFEIGFRSVRGIELLQAARGPRV